MIQVADGNIMKDSTVVLTPVRTPLEFLGSLLKLWCPSKGIGKYASGAAMISDLMTLTDINTGINATTTAGSGNITLSSSVALPPIRIKINSVARFIGSGSGTSYVLSTWMNEGTYPTTTTALMYQSFITQLNDKSGNANHLLASGTPMLLLNAKRLISVIPSLLYYYNFPKTLFKNQQKILFGAKYPFIAFPASPAIQRIIYVRNNANTLELLTISASTDSKGIYFTVQFANTATQEGIVLRPKTSSSFNIAVFIDFSVKKIYIKANELNLVYNTSSTNTFENLDNSAARLQGDGSNSSNTYMIDPVLATGSGLNQGHLDELFDYYKYL